MIGKVFSHISLFISLIMVEYQLNWLYKNTLTCKFRKKTKPCTWLKTNNKVHSRILYKWQNIQCHVQKDFQDAFAHLVSFYELLPHPSN